jgi:hypothetical protein
VILLYVAALLAALVAMNIFLVRTIRAEKRRQQEERRRKSHF